MIEAYAFLAAFTLQIVAMSVLYPARFITYVRAKAADFPTERLALMYQAVDRDRATERFVSVYRALNTVIAALGMLLLGWLLGTARGEGWNGTTAKDLATMYFLVQALPLLVVALLGIWSNTVLRRSLSEGKRKASLQRRGLLDFVSPFSVVLAVFGYLLCAAFAMYLEQNPFPGYRGALYKIGGVTALYALNAFCVYLLLYGKSLSPLESHAGRVHSIGLAVRVCVYSCIFCVGFVALDLTLGILNLRTWEPVALSGFFVILALVCLTGLSTLPVSELQVAHLPKPTE